jgi:hypothetical protein
MKKIENIESKTNLNDSGFNYNEYDEGLNDSQFNYEEYIDSYSLKCDQKQISKNVIKQSSSESIEQIQTRLNLDNYWRLFVDGNKQLPYQTDEAYSGYLKWAMREPDGLNQMRQTAERLFEEKSVKTPLSLDLIKEVHKSAFPAKNNLIFPSKDIMVDEPRHFGRFEKSEEKYLTDCALAVQKHVNAKQAPWSYNTESGAIYANWDKTEVQKYVPILIEQYESNIKKISDDSEVLKLIVRFIQDLEDIHMFQDGNCRLMYLLLNKELMRHDFAPVILKDPNNLDNYTPEKLVEEIILGQEAFKRFHTTEYPYQGCTSDNMIQTEVYDSLRNGKVKIANAINNEFIAVFEKDHRNEMDQFLSKQELNFDTFAKFWDTNILRNIFSSQNAEKQKEFVREAKIQALDFKLYCDAKNINLLKNPSQIKEQFYQFIDAIKQSIIEYENENKLSFLHPKLCHLKDKDITLEDLKNKIIFDELDQPLKELYNKCLKAYESNDTYNDFGYEQYNEYEQYCDLDPAGLTKEI